MNPNADIAAIAKLSYGVYLVTSFAREAGGNGASDKLNGCIANAVMQVTATPVKVIAVISKDNLTHDYIRQSGTFGISILSEAVVPQLIAQFGYNTGRTLNKFDGSIDYVRGQTGCPLVTSHAVATIEARVVDSMDIGTHTLFVGEVLDAQLVREGPVLTYADYTEKRKGKAPKNAPTYRGASASEGKMKKYVCDVCGHEYDPAAGDPENGIAPGTPFESLPDDWTCPTCGAGKESFSPLD